MEIKVGMYARVGNFIGEIVNINKFRDPDTEIAIDLPPCNDLIFVNRKDISKTSYNVKDLRGDK